jgi:hypothetical protein
MSRLAAWRPHWIVMLSATQSTQSRHKSDIRPDGLNLVGFLALENIVFLSSSCPFGETAKRFHSTRRYSKCPMRSGSRSMQRIARIAGSLSLALAMTLPGLALADPDRDESGNGRRRDGVVVVPIPIPVFPGHYGPPPAVRHAPRIPPGHLPPPGECRVWYPDRPAGHQPPPGRC